MHLSKDALRNPWPSIETFPKILTPVWTPKTLDEPQSWMPGLVIFAFKQQGKARGIRHRTARSTVKKEQQCLEFIKIQSIIQVGTLSQSLDLAKEKEYPR